MTPISRHLHSPLEQFLVDQLAALLKTDPASIEMHSLALAPIGGLNMDPDTLSTEVLLLRTDLSYDAIVNMLHGSALQTKLGAFKLNVSNPKFSKREAQRGRGSTFELLYNGPTDHTSSSATSVTMAS